MYVCIWALLVSLVGFRLVSVEGYSALLVLGNKYPRVFTGQNMV